MKLSPLFVLLACVAMTACNPEGPPAGSAPATETPSASAPATPAVELPTEPSGSVPAVSVPGHLAACDPPSEATVKWSFDHLPTPPELVDVYVGNNDADLKLFVTGPTRSEAKTGQWVRPGSVFVLRNHAGNEELARVVVQGPSCGL